MSIQIAEAVRAALVEQTPTLPEAPAKTPPSETSAQALAALQEGPQELASQRAVLDTLLAQSPHRRAPF